MMLRNFSFIRFRPIFFLAALLPVFFLPAACGLGPPPASVPELPSGGQRDSEAETAAASGARAVPAPEKAEVVREERPPETVVIGGKTYAVPPPWRGNRFLVPKYDAADFRRIPVEYTWNGGEVYVLAGIHRPLEALLRAAAAADGISLEVDSGYRSEGYQKRIFRRMLDQGREFEEIVRYVAPPGYSQHMLGTAVDFHPSDWRFADTPAYSWLRENGPGFGFEETYHRNNPMQMPWEAWHWNYTGKMNGYHAGAVLAPDSRKKRAGAGGE